MVKPKKGTTMETIGSYPRSFEPSPGSPRSPNSVNPNRAPRITYHTYLQERAMYTRTAMDLQNKKEDEWVGCRVCKGPSGVRRFWVNCFRVYVFAILLKSVASSALILTKINRQHLLVRGHSFHATGARSLEFSVQCTGAVQALALELPILIS